MQRTLIQEVVALNSSSERQKPMQTEFEKQKSLQASLSELPMLTQLE